MMAGSIFLMLDFFLYILSSTEGVAITTPPSSVAAPLYTQANFYCEGIGQYLFWTVQGIKATSSYNTFREIIVIHNSSNSTLSSLLVIKSKPTNNGITIGCNIYSIVPVTDLAVKGAFLFVKGISSVQNLHLSLNLSRHSWLSWSPPSFFSEWYLGTLISYQVYIVNQNGVILYNNVTKATVFELYNNNFIICNVYTATVVAYGEPYHSLNSITSVQIIEECFIDIVNNSITFTTNGDCVALFTLNIISTSKICPGFIKGIVSSNDSIETYCCLYIEQSNTNYLLIEYNMSQLQPQMKYNVSVYLIDLLNNTVCSSDEIQSVIHCLQELNITQIKNKSVRVECKFLRNCPVSGCWVVFILEEEVIYSVAIYKTHKSKEETIFQYINLTYSGYYTVHGYDIVNEYGVIFEDVVAASINNLSIIKLTTSNVLATSNIIATRNVLTTTTNILTTSSVLTLSSSIDLNILSTSMTVLIPNITEPMLPVTIVASSITVVLICGALIGFVVITLFLFKRKYIKKREKESVIAQVQNLAYSQVLPVSRRIQELQINPAYEMTINCKQPVYEQITEIKF